MTKMKLISLSFATGLALLCGTSTIFGQQTPGQKVPLNDLTAFKNPGSSWQIAGGVTADLSKQNLLNTSKGSGILINLPDKKKHGSDLISNLEHGDIELELDYLMASGSNSGIYLQGQYELQLEDSWANKTAKSANNGGIYERWDDSKQEGLKGFEGHAPRQNASKAPGLWQHLKIDFQAPKFDAAGKKIANAKFLRVELNGVLIHENVELSGPTRGAISTEEKQSGPLRFQGDHGAVAFRNIKYFLKSASNTNSPSANTNAKGSKAANADEPTIDDNKVDPILVEAPVNTILRSFMDLPGFGRVTHAVSVGSSDQVHYTYDLDKGAVVQVWRGGFLDATPMWHDRGDGSSRPAGAVQRFGKPVLQIAKLSSPQTNWITDTTGTNFKINGYELDDSDRPGFLYSIYGKQIKDAVVVTENGKGISRTITINQPSDNLYVRLAEAATIEELNGSYIVDDKSYYLRVDDAEGAKPVIRDLSGRKELIVPIRSKLSYSILF
ncbi:MAG: hypothetical protein JWQ25_2110 [Daejeonella sp.]|nr:hypothetical protein [Daejeonella sp.]